MQVAAVVIYYNPDYSVFNNLNTYVNQTERIFIVDNSDIPVDESLIDKIKSYKYVEYISNHKNIGIAAALNMGIKKAIEENFNYVLTMDQDGKATPGMVSELLKIMAASNNIGIVAAEHVDLDSPNRPLKEDSKEILYTMTNGNLLNLTAYKEIGGYLEELFIDHTDHEYCLRLNKNGYKIIKTSSTFVIHKLGKAKTRKIFNINCYPTFHPPIRLYYRTRNRFYVNSIYKKVFPQYVKEDRKHMFREFFDIIMCEKDLFNKTKMMIKGYIDYRKKKFGKYQNASSK